MNIKKSTLSVAVAGLMSVGLVGQAAAYTSAGSKIEFQNLSIGVFDSAGSPFVDDKILAADEVDGGVAVAAGDFGSVCLFPGDPADSRDEVDSKGRHAELHHHAGFCELIHG